MFTLGKMSVIQVNPVVFFEIGIQSDSYYPFFRLSDNPRLTRVFGVDRNVGNGNGGVGRGIIQFYPTFTLDYQNVTVPHYLKSHRFIKVLSEDYGRKSTFVGLLLIRNGGAIKKGNGKERNCE